MTSKFDEILNRVCNYSKTQFDKEYTIGSWGKGLLMYGVLSKFLYDQDEEALNFVRKKVNESVETQTTEGKLSGGDPSQTNFGTIGLSVLYFTETDLKAGEKDSKFSESVRKQADYFINPSLKRTDKGALYYLEMSPQIWIDTVIMICPFLARAGKVLDEPKYIEEAIKQLELHIAYLKDPETGLFRHIWDEKKLKFYEGSLWGRGNGWMIASLVEVAEQLGDDHPNKRQLITEIQRLAEGLFLCQDEEGFWRLFLDQVSEKSKVETAGTLIIAYGLSKAIRNGWIDAEFWEPIQKAFDAVITCIDEDGKVTKASGPTINPKFTQYNKPYPHAQGFFLITALELKKLLQYLKDKDIL